MEAVTDALQQYYPHFLGGEDGPAKADEACRGPVLEILAKLERRLVANAGGDGWIVGAHLSVADLALA